MSGTTVHLRRAPRVGGDNLTVHLAAKEQNGRQAARFRGVAARFKGWLSGGARPEGVAGAPTGQVPTTMPATLTRFTLTVVAVAAIMLAGGASLIGFWSR